VLLYCTYCFHIEMEIKYDDNDDKVAVSIDSSYNTDDCNDNR